MVAPHPWRGTDTIIGRHNPPEASVTSWGAPSPFRAIRGNLWQLQLHPKPDYSADLSLAPVHPSFHRRTNSYWPQMASSWLSNVNSMCTGICEFLSQQNTSLLQSQAGLSHSHTFRTGSLQHKSSPGMKMIREPFSGYSAEPFSSSLSWAWWN